MIFRAPTHLYKPAVDASSSVQVIKVAVKWLIGGRPFKECYIYSHRVKWRSTSVNNKEALAYVPVT